MLDQNVGNGGGKGRASDNLALIRTGKRIAAALLPGFLLLDCRELCRTLKKASMPCSAFSGANGCTPLPFMRAGSMIGKTPTYSI